MELGVGAYEGHPAAQFDHDSTGIVGLLMSERENSMDCQNDPRFFVKNVLERRVIAFNKLSVISGLMLGTATGEMFKLKKDFDLSELAFGWVPVGAMQLIGFLANVIVAFCCILAIFVLSQQSFYAYRLITAGATGFEQASMFYLNRTIVYWRHLAVRCLFDGMWLFIFGTGLLVFHDFYKDCKVEDKPPMTAIVLNAPWQTAAPATAAPGITYTEAPPTAPRHKLSEHGHTLLGGIFFACACGFGMVLRSVQHSHRECFLHHYNFAHAMSLPLMQQARGMGTRAGHVEHGLGARD